MNNWNSTLAWIPPAIFFSNSTYRLNNQILEFTTGENMEYVERTAETLEFDILIWLYRLGTYYKQLLWF